MPLCRPPSSTSDLLRPVLAILLVKDQGEKGCGNCRIGGCDLVCAIATESISLHLLCHVPIPIYFCPLPTSIPLSSSPSTFSAILLSSVGSWGSPWTCGKVLTFWRCSGRDFMIAYDSRILMFSHMICPLLSDLGFSVPSLNMVF